MSNPINWKEFDKDDPRWKCRECPSYRNRFVSPDIKQNSKLVCLAERPGENEVLHGSVLIGASGRVHNRILQKAGSHRDLVSNVNTVACYQTGNVTPSLEEIECCAPVVEAALNESNASIVLALGSIATTRLVGERPIMRWRGSIVQTNPTVDLGVKKVLGPDVFKSGAKKGQLKPRKVPCTIQQQSGRTVILTLHPAELMRSGFMQMPFVVEDYRRAIALSVGRPLITVGDVIVPSASVEQASSLLEKVNEIVLDVETEGKNGALTLIGLAPSQNFALSMSPSPALLNLIGPWLANPTNTLVGHNLTYDIKILEREGLLVKAKLWDTMHAAHFERPDLAGGKVTSDENDDSDSRATQRARSLDVVASRLRDYYYSNWKQAYREGREPDGQIYNGRDCCWTAALKRELKLRLAATGRLEHFQSVMMPALPVTIEMEQRGARIDTSKLAEFNALALSILQGQEAALEAGLPADPASPKQLMEYFYNKLGLTIQYTGKGDKKRPSLDRDSIDRLSALYPKLTILRTLRDWRHLKGIKEKYLELTLDSQGFLHPQYNLSGTFTGRLSGGGDDGFNFQNIPRTQATGACIQGISECPCWRLRELFVADTSGGRILCADWSQLEYRLVAILAGETWLIKAFEDPEFDIHKDTAENFGVSRVVAKGINFAIINWAGVDKIALVSGCSKQTAETFIMRARTRFPRILRYQYSLMEHAREKGWIATPFSRRGYFRVMFADGRGEIKAPEVVAFSHQSCGGSMMTRTLRRAKDAGLRIMATVHDELVVSEQKEGDMKTLKEVMETGHPELMKWGCPAEVGAGMNWAEAKK